MKQVLREEQSQQSRFIGRGTRTGKGGDGDYEACARVKPIVDLEVVIESMRSGFM